MSSSLETKTEQLAVRWVGFFLTLWAYAKVLLGPSLHRYLVPRYYASASKRRIFCFLDAALHYELRGRYKKFDLSPLFRGETYCGLRGLGLDATSISPWVHFILSGEATSPENTLYRRFLDALPKGGRPIEVQRKARKIALYSAIIDGYDRPAHLELEELKKQFPDIEFEAVLFTDRFYQGLKGWRQEFPPYFSADPKRTSGWLKTHAHVLFAG